MTEVGNSHIFFVGDKISFNLPRSQYHNHTNSFSMWYRRPPTNLPWPVKATAYLDDGRPYSQSYRVTDIFNGGRAIRVEPIFFDGEASYTLPFWFIDVRNMSICRNLTGDTLGDIKKVFLYGNRVPRDLHTCACQNCKPRFDELRANNTPGYYKLYH